MHNSFLNEAKTYYNQQIKISEKKDFNTATANLNTFDFKQKKMALWYKAKNSFTRTGIRFVEVPFIANQRRIALYNFANKPSNNQINEWRVSGSFQRLLIYKTKKNHFRQVLLTYVPDYDYLQKHRFDASHNQIHQLDKDYSGYIAYTSLKTGKVVQLLQFEKGKMIKKRYLKSRVSSGSNKSVSSLKGNVAMRGWQEQCTPIYQTPCITVGDPPVEYCQEPIQVGEDCYDVWVDDPEEPEDPDPNYNPCDDPANFWMCNPENPDPENPEEPEQPEQPPVDTLTNIQDSCIRANVDMALNSTLKNTFTDIMRNTFLNNHDLMLNIEDVTTLSDTTMGAFNQFRTQRINGVDYLTGTIQLNRNKLPNGSNEFTVATLYHEVLHAYLATWGGLMTPYSNHEYMAWEYTNNLANTLTSMFPNLSSADANALAWGGLHNTALWSIKSPTEQNAILNKLTEFRTGVKGHRCP